MNKLKVIFITTVYNEVENGPGIYANYLWDNFYKSTNVEFHLIAPDIVKQNEHLHSVNSYKSSRSLYTTIQQKALELANKLSGNVIIHVNSAHYAWLLKKHRGPVIVQINDYDVVDIYREIFSTFKQDGMRRILSLIWRRRMESIAVKNATIVVCNSEYTYTRVIDGYNLSPDKAVIVYKAVDIDYFNKITNTNRCWMI